MDTLPEQVQSLIFQLKQAISHGDATRDQVIAALTQEQIPSMVRSAHLHMHITAQRLLYYIGGFIVLIGITIFVAQDWRNLEYVGQVLVTLGSAVAAYSLGYYFLKKTTVFDLGYVFFMIAAILFPIGLGTALQHQFTNTTTNGIVTLISLILFLIYYSSYYFLHVDIYNLFATGAAVTGFFSLTNMFFPSTQSVLFYQYRTLFVGISLLCVGYYYQKMKRFFSSIYYFFGVGTILGVAFALSFVSQYTPATSVVWQILFPFLLVFFYWVSVKTQKGVILLLATLYTFAEIIKITAERFSHSLGWPLSLIIAGFVIITVGYFSFNLKKRFSGKRQDPTTPLQAQPN